MINTTLLQHPPHITHFLPNRQAISKRGTDGESGKTGTRKFRKAGKRNHGFNKGMEIV